MPIVPYYLGRPAYVWIAMSRRSPRPGQRANADAVTSGATPRRWKASPAAAPGGQADRRHNDGHSCHAS
jgi:hypothetical protein